MRPPFAIRHCLGFTLIEISIGVALAGVVAALATPPYLDSLARSRRLDATKALQGVQWQQERFRQEHGRYAVQLDQLSGGTPVRSSAGHYRLEFHTLGPDAYEMRAVAEPSQARDLECRVISLQVRGETSRFEPAGRCWNL